MIIILNTRFKKKPRDKAYLAYHGAHGPLYLVTKPISCNEPSLSITILILIVNKLKAKKPYAW